MEERCHPCPYECSHHLAPHLLYHLLRHFHPHLASACSCSSRRAPRAAGCRLESRTWGPRPTSASCWRPCIKASDVLINRCEQCCRLWIHTTRFCNFFAHKLMVLIIIFLSAKLRFKLITEYVKNLTFYSLVTRTNGGKRWRVNSKLEITSM